MNGAYCPPGSKKTTKKKQANRDALLKAMKG